MALLNTVLCRLCDTMDSQYIHSNVNGPSRKQTGLVIGLPHMALIPGKRKFAQFGTWTVLLHLRTYATSSPMFISTMTYGQVAHMFSGPSEAVWALKRRCH
eukprot:CCRYP_003754-RA/>CCRYP_003754-RA protein AED:0.42 eAED:0.25 QI:0/-1/0/1/-1/0/1/0/100